MEIKKIESEQGVNEVVELFLSVMTKEPYNENWTPESARGELMEIYENGKDFCFVAREDGQVIGLIFSRVQPWEGGEHLIIEYVVVNPNARKGGIGTQLFLETEKVAKEKGINNLHLISHRQAMAKEFWEKQGFKMQGVIEMVKNV